MQRKSFVAGALFAGAAAIVGAQAPPSQNPPKKPEGVLVAPQVGVTAFNFPPGAHEIFTASLGGELGLGYNLNRDPGLFLQPGIELSYANVVFLRVDHAFGRDSDTHSYTHAGSMDLGARLAPAGTRTVTGGC